MDELISKYTNAYKLTTEESKKDPETEPYKSKYLAKALLLEVKDTSACKLDSLDPESTQFVPFKALYASTLCQIGLICVDTEEPSEGEKYFKECYDSIIDHLDPYFILASIDVRNQFGILCSQRSEPLEAQKWLEGAEKLYEEFKSSGKVPKHFLSENEKFNVEKELEGLHTSTKYFLAQIYGLLKDFLKSAFYCHETLKRQLICNEYDSISWALSSATLSQVFLERTYFKQARHHLAAASYILDVYEESLKTFSGSQEELDAKKEELAHRSSDVSRCWAKYGIFILEYSKDRLNESSEELPKPKNERLEQLAFDSLDLTAYENEVTDTEVVLFEDAREVFLFTQKHLNKAKEYYSLEDRASDNIQIVQDHSHLFKHLQCFEQDEERQCKMMRRRINMLEAVLKELNPKYYLNECRQIWFELGETYHDIMHMKYQKVKDSKGVPEPHILKSINTLTSSSILNFNNFLDSIKTK